MFIFLFLLKSFFEKEFLAIEFSQNNLSGQKETIFWHKTILYSLASYISSPPITFFMLWFESIHSHSPSLSRFVIAVTHFEFQMYYSTTVCVNSYYSTMNCLWTGNFSWDTLYVVLYLTDTISFRARKYLYFTRPSFFSKKHWNFWCFDRVWFLKKVYTYFLQFLSYCL